MKTTAHKPRDERGLISGGLFSACLFGNHLGDDHGCPGVVLDIKCTCKCHEGKSDTGAKPTVFGWCNTRHHDECIAVTKDGKWVCDCPCHRKFDQRPAPQKLAGQKPEPPRLKLVKRKRKRT